jgi:hypothetical protein
MWAMDEIPRRVMTFVASHHGVDEETLRPHTTLGDIGVDGDDGSTLLEEFGREFSVDLAGCDPRHFFGLEGIPVWGPLYWLWLAFRGGKSEERARLRPIRIADLIRSAETGRWTLDD